MTDFNLIANELATRGWVSKQGSGDHIMFSHPEKKGTLIVSKSLSSSNRSYKNMLATIRRYEPDFMRKVVKKKTDVEEQPKEPSLKIEPPVESKPLRPLKDYEWLHAGVKVVMAIDPDVVWTVQSVDSPDQTTVCKDSDLLTLEHQGETILATIADVDAVETRECMCCHRQRPINHFSTKFKQGSVKLNYCRECIDTKAFLKMDEKLAVSPNVTSKTKSADMPENKKQSQQSMPQNDLKQCDSIELMEELARRGMVVAGPNGEISVRASTVTDVFLESLPPEKRTRLLLEHDYLVPDDANFVGKEDREVFGSLKKSFAYQELQSRGYKITVRRERIVYDILSDEDE